MFVISKKEQSQYFHSNLVSVKSLLRNICFGLKEVLGTGDCGFICLMIGIISDIKVTQWFDTAVLEFYEEVSFGKNLEKFAHSKHITNSKKQLLDCKNYFSTFNTKLSINILRKNHPTNQYFITSMKTMIQQ